MITLSLKTVKAKKEHICSYCGGIINPGEKYQYSTHIYDGQFYEWKAHMKCQNLAMDLNLFDDCDEGLTEEAFHESINCAYSDHDGPDQGKERYTQKGFEERINYLIRILSDE